MREKFSVPELTALKSELLQGFDSKDATELVQMFWLDTAMVFRPRKPAMRWLGLGLLDALWKRFKESWRALR